MKPEVFESKLRAGEIYHGLSVPDGVWPILRVDGRAFHTILEGFIKPFDSRVHNVMIAVAAALMCNFEGLYGYTQSDEVSILLPLEWSQFDRHVEKMVSISAGVASAAWVTHSMSEPWGPQGHFDARIWIGRDSAEVYDYLRWRMADCMRHAIQSSAYWLLRNQQGKRPRAAASQLRGQNSAQMQAWLLDQGLDLATWPPPFLRGSALFWTTAEQEGYNPIRGETTIVKRRKLTVCSTLPEGAAYNAWLRDTCPALTQETGS